MTTLREARNRFAITLTAALLTFAGVAALASVDAAAERQGHHHHYGHHHYGADRGQMMDRLFERHDADGDGRLTREEMEAARAARAERLDRDGDGTITREEFIEVARERAAERAARRAERHFDRMADDGEAVATDDLGAAWIDRLFERAGVEAGEGLTREDLKRAQRKRD